MQIQRAEQNSLSALIYRLIGDGEGSPAMSYGEPLLDGVLNSSGARATRDAVGLCRRTRGMPAYDARRESQSCASRAFASTGDCAPGGCLPARPL